MFLSFPSTRKVIFFYHYFFNNVLCNLFSMTEAINMRQTTKEKSREQKTSIGQMR